MSETSSTLPSEFTGRFGARRTADLVEKIEKINSGSKEPLTRFEIQTLSQMNKEAVAAMTAQLTVEANTVWDKNADPSTIKNHKDYWSGYAARLQAAIEAYDGKLAQITIGANDDLLKLKKTTEAGNVLGDAARKNAVAVAPTVSASAPVATAATAAPATAATAAAATPETKETAPGIKTFIERIKNSKLNPVQRVKTDITVIENLLAKGDITKLPKGVDLTKITTRDLQRALKVEADGELGPVTINALLEIMDVKEMYDAKPFVGTKKMKNKSSSNQTPTRKEQIRKADQEKDEKVTPAEDIGWDTFRTANQTKAYNEEIKKAEQAKAEEIKKAELLEVEELRKAVQSSDPTPSIV